ncbi:hypothetical protein NA63_2439 [Flavobacteriaceae bacterium MAR_2010_105]|nr:hypothetical protein NA63_2439 [Flavobacteriaceae bacterium MAR_2010_105]
MKIPMIVMIIIITLLCVLPYLWFIQIGKNNTKKKQKLFTDATKAENVSVNTKEQWNNNFIGIDTSKNILVFIKIVDQETIFYKIDIRQIKSCEINIKTRDYKTEKKVETKLQSLSLELAIASQIEPVILNFYDINEEFQEDFEMKRAEKWKTLILNGRDQYNDDELKNKLYYLHNNDLKKSV